MEIDKNKYYQKIGLEVAALQRKMLEYDQSLIQKRLNEGFSVKRRTIAEEEDIIINKFGGKKLDTNYFYKHLSDFGYEMEEIEYLKLVSPCKIIFNYTEELIPDEYFYSFYLISLKENEKQHDKDLIVYITSRDGINVYISSALKNYQISPKELDRKICSAICYYEDGIAVYYEEMEGK